MNSSATAAVAVGEMQEMRPLMNLNSSKLKVPLTETSEYFGDTSKPLCQMCNASFAVGPSLSWKGIGTATRADYGLCPRHYISAYYAIDSAGLRSAEHALLQHVPVLYRDAEFNTFRASGPCKDHLAKVRSEVASWAENAARDWWVPAGADKAGSIYLYASHSKNYTGNGCGKSHLAYSAFKYIARRTVTGWVSNEPLNKPVFTCAFIDIQGVVAEFRKRQAAGNAGDKVWYNYDLWNGSRTSTSFDDYLANLAAAPVLFIDDIGSGRYFDKQGAPSLAGTTFETIVDIRSQNGLPTLYTSNLSPEELGDRVGTRAASRIFRGVCKQIRVEAPDYAISQSMLNSPPSFRMFSALGKV